MSRIDRVKNLARGVHFPTLWAMTRLLRLPSLANILMLAKEHVHPRVKRTAENFDEAWTWALGNLELIKFCRVDLQRGFKEGRAEVLETLIGYLRQQKGLITWATNTGIVDEEDGLSSYVKYILSEECSELRNYLVNYENVFVKPVLEKDFLRQWEPDLDSKGFINWKQLADEKADIFFTICDLICWDTNERLIGELHLQPNLEILDLGAGSLLFASQLIQYEPTLTVQALDLFTRNNLDARVRIIERSLFEKGSPSFNKVVLGWILHDWSDANAIEILKAARSYLKVGGDVWIVEQVQPQGGPKPNSTLDLLVGLHTGQGKERTLKEYCDLAKHAGLGLQKTLSVNGSRDLMIFSEVQH